MSENVATLEEKRPSLLRRALEYVGGGLATAQVIDVKPLVLSLARRDEADFSDEPYPEGTRTLIADNPEFDGAVELTAWLEEIREVSQIM